MAFFHREEGLTYDDVLLVPQYSELSSRMEADTSTVLGGLNLKIPILSANMDTVTGLRMAQVLATGGAAGVLHRYADKEEIISWIQPLMAMGLYAIPSVGVSEKDRLFIEELWALGVEHICIDIAHGHSKVGIETTKIAAALGFKTIIAGNVATADGVRDLANAGANVIKVGVGPGSACSTRIVTGHGVPQLSAVLECATKAKELGVCIIADGGLKNSGDIAKALAAGAQAVMTGSLFAGCNETPHGTKEYRGMASEAAQLAFRGKVNNDAPEGVLIEAPDRGSALDVLNRLAGGIRSAMSYSGVTNLKDFRENAIFRKCSANTVIENAPRQLK